MLSIKGSRCACFEKGWVCILLLSSLLLLLASLSSACFVPGTGLLGGGTEALLSLTLWRFEAGPACTLQDTELIRHHRTDVVRKHLTLVLLQTRLNSNLWHISSGLIVTDNGCAAVPEGRSGQVVFGCRKLQLGISLRFDNLAIFFLPNRVRLLFVS